MSMDPQKRKALEMAIKQIDKTFGKGTLMRLGDKEIEPIAAISTGSLGLDMALGIGGIPQGRIIEIYGPNLPGKPLWLFRVSHRLRKMAKYAPS